MSLILPKFHVFYINFGLTLYLVSLRVFLLSGLAQCHELCKQLRQECGVRQVKNAKIGLQHNLGLGGACVVGLYKKYKPLQLQK